MININMHPSTMSALLFLFVIFINFENMDTRPDYGFGKSGAIVILTLVGFAAAVIFLLKGLSTQC